MKDIGVLVIHGIGSQGKERPSDTAELKYSDKLYKRVRKDLGGPQASRVAWREVFWSDILQARQSNYLKAIKRRTRYDFVRRFVLCNLSDAAAYRITPTDDADDTYQRIHERVDETLSDLDNDVKDGAPLIILAHSMGGHIMSNHIYDRGKSDPSDYPAFQRFKTMAALVTFGCNIPLFMFSYDPDDIFPIDFPGTDLPDRLKFKTWWQNYYDKDDVLGYPLRDIGPRYEQMVRDGALKDIPIDSGGLFTSWNPASHNAYWRDDDLYKPIAKLIAKVLR